MLILLLHLSTFLRQVPLVMPAHTSFYSTRNWWWNCLGYFRQVLFDVIQFEIAWLFISCASYLQELCPFHLLALSNGTDSFSCIKQCTADCLTWFFPKEHFSCNETQWDFSPLASKSTVEPLKGFTSVKYYPQDWEIKSKWAFFLFPLRHVRRTLGKRIAFPSFQNLPECISIAGFEERV